MSDVFLDVSPHYVYFEARSHLNPELEDLVNQAGEAVLWIPVCSCMFKLQIDFHACSLHLSGC